MLSIVAILLAFSRFLLLNVSPSNAYTLYDLVYTMRTAVSGSNQALTSISGYNRVGFNNIVNAVSVLNSNFTSGFWYNSYTPGRMLYELWDDLEYIANGKSYSVANSAYGIWEDVETLDGHVVSNGSLVSKGFSDVLSSSSLIAGRLVANDSSIEGNPSLNVARILIMIKQRLGDTYNGTYYTTGQLQRIAVSRLDTLRDNAVSDASMVSKGFSDVLGRLSANDSSIEGNPSLNVARILIMIKQRLGDTYNGTYYTAGQLLRIIVTRLDTLRSNGVSRDSLISKGFSDLIAALDTREVVVTGDLQLGDVTVDNSDVVEQIQTSNALLGNIVDLLFLAGVKDVVDDFLGDFENLIGAAQLASVQAAMQNAFPFCVPAIFKQVLGLLEYEGAPPVYEFDIAGAPLVLDFSVAEDFAEISRWVVTVSFVLFLLANTKRFVFDFSGVLPDGRFRSLGPSHGPALALRASPGAAAHDRRFCPSRGHSRAYCPVPGGAQLVRARRNPAFRADALDCPSARLQRLPARRPHPAGGHPRMTRFRWFRF